MHHLLAKEADPGGRLNTHTHICIYNTVIACMHIHKHRVEYAYLPDPCITCTVTFLRSHGGRHTGRVRTHCYTHVEVLFQLLRSS